MSEQVSGSPERPGPQPYGQPYGPPSGSPPAAGPPGGTAPLPGDGPAAAPPPPRRYPTGPPPAGPGSPGFLPSLFDFSFRRFVTTKVVPVVYGLVMAGAALYALVLLAVGFRISAGVGILFLLVICPLFFLLVIAVYRVLLELAVVIFRIAENLEILVRSRERL